MTDIAFHFNVPGKVAYSCKLLRKAHATGARLTVLGPASVLSQLDEQLWNFSTVDFVPHYWVTTARQSHSDVMHANMLAATPVVLVESLQDCTHSGVLVNLGHNHNVPDEFERFERIIEVVSTAQDDRLAARHRWRHYEDKGYTLEKCNLALLGVSA